MVRRTGTAYHSGRGKSGQCINWLNQGKGQGRRGGAQASLASQLGAWEGLKCEYSSRGYEVLVEAPLKRPSSVLVWCYPGGATVLPTPPSIVTLHIFVNRMSAKTDIRMQNPP